MKYEKHISKLRHLMVKVQGTDLQQVLLRAAAKRAEEISDKLYTQDEIFAVAKEKILENTNKLSWNESFELVSDVESLAILKNELIENSVEEFEWEETLSGLLEGTSATEQKILAPLLNNQHAFVRQEKAEMKTRSVAGQHTLIPDGIMYGVVKRVFGSNFEAGKLVGVQPMSGPVGVTYHLRYRAEDPETKKVTDAKSFDDNEGKRITMEVVSQATEAQSRRLSSYWTMEASQDLNSMYGLDLESEMTQALASEIQSEISNDIIVNIKALAGEPVVANLKPDDSLEQKAKLLGLHINLAANEIARKTRRGAGNWIVVSPTILSLLAMTKSDGTYEQKDSEGFGLFGELMEVGTLNKTMKVFSALHLPDDEVVIGYKGSNGECDAGYTYCPYVPILTCGVVVDPKTFQPKIPFMTRAGHSLNGGYEYDDKGEKLTDEAPMASNYYSVLKVTGLDTKKE